MQIKTIGKVVVYMALADLRPYRAAHRSTRHRHLVSLLDSQQIINNAAEMVSYYFAREGQNATAVLEHGCFCSHLHSKASFRRKPRERITREDEICGYNHVCSECSQQETRSLFADTERLGNSCHNPYPYTITLDDCGFILCDDIANACQQSKCECDLKTASDLYGIHTDSLSKVRCVHNDENTNGGLKCCGTSPIYLSLGSTLENQTCTVNHHTGFPEVSPEDGSILDQLDMLHRNQAKKQKC